MPSLYIVIAVDTEGPLTETLKDTFQRINDYFGIKINPSIKNLKKLQNSNYKIPKNDKQKIKEILNPHFLNTHKNWKELNNQIKLIFSKKFRKNYTDNANQEIIFDWYCLDHINFKTNPRKRDIGHHKVYDKYFTHINKNDFGDQIQWHFHPIPFNLKANSTGNNINFTSSHIEILTRKIIDRNWFPSSFRPTSSIRTDLNLFLEQWIPFDLSNSNIKNYETQKKKSSRITSVYGLDNDSRGAPTDWSIYNPDVLDTRKKGILKRYIGRCLNVISYNLAINEKEVISAFQRSKKHNTLLSVTLHDFRNIENEVNRLYEIVKKVAYQFPNQKFYWSNTVNAFRNCIGLKKQSISAKINISSNILYINSKNKIWGIQPFLAIQTKKNEYIHDNLIPDSETKWRYSFDKETIELKDIKKIGIAFNNLYGSTIVYVADVTKKEFKWKINKYN